MALKIKLKKDYTIMRYLILLLLPLQLVATDTFFWVVIPSYNNEKYVEKNLRSLFDQDYKNWHAVYINDASTDKTGKKVIQMIKKYGVEKKCHYYQNQKRQGAMANIYKGVTLAPEKNVVVLLDGDDALKGKRVLSMIAEIYKDPNIWMTYGNYEAKPKELFSCDPCIETADDVKKNNSYRHAPWIYYPLRTFYAKLFHKIKVEDLMYKGQFLPVVSDTGYMLPMLEMANGHIRYVKKVIYTYHVDRPDNDFKAKLPLMQEVSKHIRSHSAYKTLERLFDE